MHNCPICDAMCVCDWDDTGGLPVPDECRHICSFDDDEDEFELDFEEYEEFMDFEEDDDEI
jgi:hypothetical protein